MFYCVNGLTKPFTSKLFHVDPRLFSLKGREEAESKNE